MRYPAIFAKSKKGSSLLSVLFGIALVTMVSVGVGQLLTLSTSRLKRTATKNDISVLKNQIDSTLQRSAACIYNLKTLNAVSFGSPSSFILTQLKEESGPATYNTPIIPGLAVPIAAGSNLIPTSILLTKTGTTDPPSPVLVTASTKLFMTDLRISFAQPLGEAALSPLVIGIVRVETDLGGIIQTCEIIPPGDASDLCADLGLIWDAVAQDCMGTPAQICAGINGALDVDGKCITVPANITCGVGAVLHGYTAGVIDCSNPAIPGTWSAWGPCLGGEKTRSCLFNSCVGAFKQTCP